jgi:AcrR family transcriptional regulator
MRIVRSGDVTARHRRGRSVPRKATPSAAGRPQPPENRADHILETAARLFFERGYGSVSIRDIGAAAGLSSSTLYHYFVDKQEILYAITERFATGFDEALGAVAERPAGPAERLYALVVAQITFQHARRHHMLQGNHFRLALNDEQRAHVISLWRRHRDRVRATIDDGVAAGELAVADPTLAASMVLDLVDGLWQWFAEAGRHPIDDLAHVYAIAALRLCGASPEVQASAGARAGATADA